MADDVVHLLAIIARERRDDEASFASASGGRDEAFLLEAVERAADGRATESEAFADDALRDARAGRELTPDDDTAQVVIGARDVVEAFVGAVGIPRSAALRGGLGGRA